MTENATLPRTQTCRSAKIQRPDLMDATKGVQIQKFLCETMFFFSCRSLADSFLQECITSKVILVGGVSNLIER